MSVLQIEITSEAAVSADNPILILGPASLMLVLSSWLCKVSDHLQQAERLSLSVTLPLVC